VFIISRKGDADDLGLKVGFLCDEHEVLYATAEMLGTFPSMLKAFGFDNLTDSLGLNQPRLQVLTGGCDRSMPREPTVLNHDFTSESR
jgi:hypothetical protein